MVVEKRKLLSLFALLILVGSTYPFILFFLGSVYGDLGNLDVIAYYVPWIFHLMLIEFVGMIGLGALGLWIAVNMGDEEKQAPAVQPKKKQASPKKPTKKPAPKKTRKKKEPQVKVSYVNEEPPKKKKSEAPDAWKEREFE